jgi:hypothetical protein
MAERNDARAWLRSHGYGDVAETIDRLMDDWKVRGVNTRRNWWDVLAGDQSGKPRIVGGVAFPVLAAARRRKGWPGVASAIERVPNEDAPKPTEKGRWTAGEQHQTTRQGRVRRSASPRGTGTQSPKRQPSKKPPTQKDESSSVSGFTRGERSNLMTLSVRRFAHLEYVEMPLADLVALVGPQATGKSLVLELLKLAVDRSRIVRSLRKHGLVWKTPQEFAELFFGGGFEKSWGPDTLVNYGGEPLTLRKMSEVRARTGEDAVFYIPAHRTLAIAEGWPRPFTQYQVETPYVARRFSEAILTAINQGLVGKGKIFPHDRRLKDAFRRLIDDAVFHGATLKLDTLGMRKQFVLEYPDNKARLPYMAWTAGQREFTPLLLGLYHLLPAGGAPKKREIQWAILEEPEMGLHPKAIVAVMAVVLDLLARGYKVALSTHSPTVLEVIWGMSRLKGHRDGAVLLCKMMGLPEKDRNVVKTATEALKRNYAVIHVQHSTDGRVVSKDISHLDPGAADPSEWGWGGLTGFSASVSEVVAQARSEVRGG